MFIDYKTTFNSTFDCLMVWVALMIYLGNPEWASMMANKNWVAIRTSDPFQFSLSIPTLRGSFALPWWLVCKTVSSRRVEVEGDKLGWVRKPKPRGVFLGKETLPIFWGLVVMTRYLSLSESWEFSLDVELPVIKLVKSQINWDHPRSCSQGWIFKPVQSILFDFVTLPILQKFKISLI